MMNRKLLAAIFGLVLLRHVVGCNELEGMPSKVHVPGASSNDGLM